MLFLWLPWISVFLWRKITEGILSHFNHIISRTYTIKLIYGFFFFLLPHPPPPSCGILVPPPGIELAPPALEARRLNHWTSRKVPKDDILHRIVHRVWQLLGSLVPLLSPSSGHRPLHIPPVPGSPAPSHPRSRWSRRPRRKSRARGRSCPVPGRPALGPPDSGGSGGRQTPLHRAGT